MILAGENTKPFDTKRSLEEAAVAYTKRNSITLSGKTYTWRNKLKRVEVIRQGLPYDIIEIISKRLGKPVKTILALIGLPQTTYNKKKNEHALLGARDSELVLAITTLIDYGIEVFDQEESKFQRWLEKPNLSLGGSSPEELLDTLTGISEVKQCLDRIEYGNFA